MCGIIKQISFLGQIMKHLEVVAGVIVKDGKILCTQREESKYSYVSQKWEFPGGKIEQGESHQTALKRELKEELNIDVTVNDLICSINHTYPDFTITLHFYYCSGDLSSFTLNVHKGYKWLLPKDLKSLSWAPADTKIIDILSTKEF